MTRGWPALSADVNTPRKTGNPYVGPQSFRRDDRFYGRQNETADLLDLVIAERIVLLYSPSGAGKSSLIQAGLIPHLEEEGLEVLPVVRVTRELPPNSSLSGSPRNRYVLSTLLTLDEGLPREHQRDIRRLDEMTIAEYLSQWPDLDGRPGNEVLIFDQFEEIITADPTDHQAKREFFADVGAALRDRKLWALFSIREDFLAELDSYARSIPTRLERRYRLDLLTVDQALEAMILPARDVEINFTPAAAQKLVDDLRRIRVQRPGGVTEAHGPNVEPVQLQVACKQIWDRLDQGARAIDMKDVEAVGNVDEALAKYYADCVADVAAKSGVSERALRDWFERELVTPQGIRGQVLQGPQQSGASGERAVRMLTDAHLVRADSHRGATWYELAHDRLIAPVQEDNARWREAHLSDFERRAAWWDEQSRPDHLLLAAAELTAAEATEAGGTDPLPPRERDFLEASRKAREQVERERRTHKLTRACLVVAVIGCVLAGVAAVSASRARSRAEELATTAEVTAIAGQAAGAVGWDVDLSLLLAQEAATRLGAPGQDLDADTRNALQLAADKTPVVRVMRGHGPATEAVYSGDGMLIATHHDDGSVVVWDATSGEKRYELSGLPDGLADPQSLEFSQDGTRLSAVASDGTVAVWSIERDGAGEPTFWQAHTGTESYRVAFSPDGSRIASTGLRGLSLLDETGQPVPGFDVSPSADLDGYEIEWAADGQQLVVADGTGAVTVWDAQTGRRLRENYRHTTTAIALDVSPSRSLVASASSEIAVITDLESGAEIHRLESAGIVDVSFSADGSRLVVVHDFGDVSVIDPSTAGVRKVVTATGMSLVASDVDPTYAGHAVLASKAGEPAVWDLTAGHSQYETAVESGPDGTVFTASYDGSVNAWSPDRRPRPLIPASPDTIGNASLSQNGELLGVARTSGAVEVWSTESARPVLSEMLPDAAAWAIALSPDGRYVAAGGSDGLVSVWDISTGELVQKLDQHTDGVMSVEYGKDAHQLVSASLDTTAIVWDLDQSAPGRVLRLETNPTAVAWNSDGTVVAVGGDDGAVQFWDPRSGKRQHEGERNERARNEHAAVVNDISFDASGGRLVSGSGDRSVIVWDARDGKIEHRIRHAGLPYRVGFSGGGDRVLVTDGTGVPHVVWLDGAELLRIAQERTTRDLSPAECRVYLAADECPAG